MRLFTCLIFVLLLNANLAEAQRGGRGQGGGPPMIMVKGKVVDGNAGSPLEFATLTFFSKGQSLTSPVVESTRVNLLHTINYI